MKRSKLTLTLVAIVSAGGLFACERQDALSQYDPKVDSLLPQNTQAVDLSILENQKKLYDDMVTRAGPRTTPAPAAATPAPATTAPAIEAPAEPAPAAPATPPESPPPAPPA